MSNRSAVTAVTCKLVTACHKIQKLDLKCSCDNDLGKCDHSRESQMKRILLVLAVLAFALPAVADPIVSLDGANATYAVRVADSGTRDVASNRSGGVLHAPTGLSGNVSHVFSDAQTEMLTASSTGNGNGEQITSGNLRQVIPSDAGGFENAWKVTLGAGYVKPPQHRPMAAPEPESLSLLGTGLVFIGAVVRRKL